MNKTVDNAITEQTQISNDTTIVEKAITKIVEEKLAEAVTVKKIMSNSISSEDAISNKSHDDGDIMSIQGVDNDGSVTINEKFLLKNCLHHSR